KSTLAIVSFAQYEWFEEWKDKQVHKRGEDYEELKKTFVDTIMQTVFKLYPRIQDRIEYISGGTPLTNQHYLASPRGEFYGVNHDLPRLQAEAIATLRAQTAVPNLYLTGTVATTTFPAEDTSGEAKYGGENLQQLAGEEPVCAQGGQGATSSLAW
ncbi:PREDICTED: putative all-trans-retinol 13,14-reductase, partial [Merops nubicus]|uniref:putative all-trans-retinol 13,14-reductase n=1 Tax=Merops nubicus TaxID=57421 RepID=UPI0004F070E4